MPLACGFLDPQGDKYKICLMPASDMQYEEDMRTYFPVCEVHRYPVSNEPIRDHSGT